MTKEHIFYRRVISNTTYLIVGSLFANFTMFLANVLMARHFVPSDYGVITLIISISMSFVLIADMGIPMALTTFIPEDISEPKRLSRLVSSALILTCILALVATVLLWLGSSWIAEVFVDKTISPLIKLSALWIGCYLPFRVINGVFHGFQRMDYSLASSLLFNGIRFVCLITILYLGLGTNFIIAGWTISQLISMCLIMIIFFSFLKKKAIKLQWTSSQKLRIIKYSIYLALPFWGIYLTPYFLKILTGWLSDAENVAFLSVSLSLSSLSLLFLIPVSNSFLPVVSEAFVSANWQRVNILSEVSFKYLLLFNLGVLFLLLFYGDKIIILIYGSKYLAANNALIIMAYAIFFESTKAITNPLLNGAKYARTVTKIELLKFALICILGITLIGINGITGAATAMLIACVVSTVLKIQQVQKKLDINLVRIMLEFIPLVLALALFVFLKLPPWPFILLALAVILYFKMLSLNEIRIILSLFKNPAN